MKNFALLALSLLMITACSAPQTQTQDTPAAGTNTYTSAEVALHATADDCWVIIEGGVYDVTSYLPRHPGGAQEITPFCGQDATSMFNNRDSQGGHSSNAVAQRESVRIGDLQN